VSIVVEQADNDGYYRRKSEQFQPTMFSAMYFCVATMSVLSRFMRIAFGRGVFDRFGRVFIVWHRNLLFV
jgi:hypothetical protein